MFPEPAEDKSRDGKTSFFPARGIPTAQVNVTPMLKRPLILSRLSRGRVLPSTFFPWSQPFRGPLWACHSDHGLWVAKSAGRLTSADLDQRTEDRMKGIGSLLPLLLLILNVPSSRREAVVCRGNDSEMVFMTRYFRIYRGPWSSGKAAYYLPLDVFQAHFPIEVLKEHDLANSPLFIPVVPSEIWMLATRIVQCRCVTHRGASSGDNRSTYFITVPERLYVLYALAMIIITTNYSSLTASIMMPSVVNGLSRCCGAWLV